MSAFWQSGPAIDQTRRSTHVASETKCGVRLRCAGCASVDVRRASYSWPWSLHQPLVINPRSLPPASLPLWMPSHA
eukprot:218839-Chlamydomonas_euryale.AAC.16